MDFHPVKIHTIYIQEGNAMDIPYIMSDPDESYGAFAVQSTGFAGLSVAEAYKKGSSYTV